MSTTTERVDDRTLIKVQDLAKRWSMGRTKIYEMIESGELQSVKIGASRRIPLSAIKEFEARLTGVAVNV